MKIGANRLTLVLLGAGLVLLQGAGLFLQTRNNFDGVVAITLVEGLVYLIAVGRFTRIPADRHSVWFILLVAVVLRVATVVFPPYLSSDVYRYVWDGRVQAAGINPYHYVPSDDVLAPLRDDAIYPHINRASYARTIYPPAAQILYYAVTRISERVTAMKLAMVAFDLATIGLLLLLLRDLRTSPNRVLIYAWHPLTLWEIAGSGHVDAVVVALLALALLARQRDWPVLTGISIGLGALVKFFPIVIAPAVYRRWDWRMPAALGITVVSLYLPYLSAGSQVLGFLPRYASEERLTTGSGFYLVSLISNLGAGTLSAIAYVCLAGLILGGLALFVSLRRNGDDGYLVGSFILAIALLLLATPHYPWYFLWLLPFLCLTPYWPGLLLTAASFVLYVTLEDRSPAREFLVNTLLYGSFGLAAAIHVCVHRWLGAPLRRAET